MHPAAASCLVSEDSLSFIVMREAEVVERLAEVARLAAISAVASPVAAVMDCAAASLPAADL